MRNCSRYPRSARCIATSGKTCASRSSTSGSLPTARTKQLVTSEKLKTPSSCKKKLGTSDMLKCDRSHEAPSSEPSRRVTSAAVGAHFGCEGSGGSALHSAVSIS